MTHTTAVIATDPAGRAGHRPLRQATARYAIYPTEDHFNGRFGSPELMAALSRRRTASQTVCTPLAVHVRIPFHGTRHHPLIGQAAARHHERVVPYLEALEREVTLVVEQIGACRTVSRLHVGGDSPGCLGDGELARLMGLLRRNFHLEHDAEVAIEIDPATVDARRLAHLREIGFDHLVMTVQDTAREALDQLASLVATARGLAFASIDAKARPGSLRARSPTWPPCKRTGSACPRTIAGLSKRMIPCRSRATALAGRSSGRKRCPAWPPPATKPSAWGNSHGAQTRWPSRGAKAACT